MNRFFDIRGDVSVQLAPWVLRDMGKPINVALFELVEDIRFLSAIAGGVIVVPKGRISDLASIPQAVWSIFMAPDDPRIELGAWVHDLLYECEGKLTLEGGQEVQLTRAECDRILCHEAMVELLASTLRCFEAYESLRLFGDRWAGQVFA